MDRKSRKCLNQKNNKRPAYKCTHCTTIGHLEPFCFDKLKGSKGNHIISSMTNAHGPKKIWSPKVKP